MSDEISRALWSKCELCGKSLEEIKKSIGGENVYFSRAFKKHLKDEHQVALADYFFDILKLDRKKCPCGICNKDLAITCSSSKIVYRNMACGRNDGVKRWSEEAKTSRLGENNPMFGIEAWNKGLTKETNEIVARVAQSRVGREVTEETRAKQSANMYRRRKEGFSGNTGNKHSEETLDFLRKNTLRLIAEGRFGQTKSKPHIEFSRILDELSIKYEEEKTVGYFSFDFYLVDYDIYIEVDGDYFHSNPKLYPNGPETKTQKVNRANDTRKNTYLKNLNKKLIRFWECEVLTEKERVSCLVKELCQSNL